MAASESDFQTLDPTDTTTHVKDQWAELMRSVQALTAVFLGKVASGTEPADVLHGIAFGQQGQTTAHLDWRIVVDSNDDILIQENTGTQASPTWTTHVTIDSTGLTSGSLPSHNHAAGDVTSGTFADARISESSVTQHQAAIDHGSLAGTGDDDHTQYALADGTRDFTGTVTIDKGTDAAFTALVLEQGSVANQDVDLDFNDKDSAVRWRLRSAQAGHFELYRGATKVMDLRSTAKANTIFSDTNGVGIGGSSASGVALNVTGEARADTMGTDNANEWDSAQGIQETTTGSSGGTYTMNLTAGNYFDLTLSENVTTHTINTAGAPNGWYTLVIRQPGAGGPYTFAWNASIKWDSGGAAPTISSGASDIDIYTIFLDKDGSLHGAIVSQASA